MQTRPLDYRSPQSDRPAGGSPRVSQRFVAIHGINLCVGAICFGFVMSNNGWARLVTSPAAGVLSVLQFIFIMGPAWTRVLSSSHLTVRQKTLLLLGTSAGTVLSGMACYLGWTTARGC
jgi:hypothetical protein